MEEDSHHAGTMRFHVTAMQEVPFKDTELHALRQRTGRQGDALCRSRATEEQRHREAHGGAMVLVTKCIPYRCTGTHCRRLRLN